MRRRRAVRERRRGGGAAAEEQELRQSPSARSRPALHAEPEPEPGPTGSISSSGSSGGGPVRNIGRARETEAARSKRQQAYRRRLLLRSCGLPDHALLQEVASEEALLLSLALTVQRVDPDFLMGYEPNAASFGYLIKVRGWFRGRFG